MSNASGASGAKSKWAFEKSYPAGPSTIPVVTTTAKRSRSILSRPSEWASVVRVAPLAWEKSRDDQPAPPPQTVPSQS